MGVNPPPVALPIGWMRPLMWCDMGCHHGTAVEKILILIFLLPTDSS